MAASIPIEFLMTPEQLFSALQSDSPPLVLVANQRLVKTLSERYARFRRAQGDSVWETPALTTFEHWLAEQGRQMVYGGVFDVAALPDVVLDDDEAVRLWQDIIDQAERDHPLLSTADLAKQAHEAHGVLLEYQDQQAVAPVSEEFQHFLRWQSAMLDALKQRQWCTSAQWQATLLQALRQQRLPTHLVLAGFDQLRPWLRQVLEQIEQHGGRIDTLQENTATATLARVSPTDAADEHRVIAGWAKSTLQQQPNAKLAIVATDLAARKTALVRALREALEPEHLLQFDDRPSPLINISLGAALADYPIVADALRLLTALSQETIITRQWSALMLSPYIGFGNEADQRAAFDAWWREQGLSELRRASFLRLLASDAPTACRCPQTAEHWQQAFEQCQSLRHKRLPLRDWAEPLKQLLQLFLWPGSRPLASVEYQCREAFFKALQNLQLARWPEQPVGFSTAVQELRKRVQTQVFQAQQPGTAKIHVMGLLEAAGVEADAIWLLDARDDRLPAPLRPNPLLPFAWQQRVQAPRASHQREQFFVEQTLQRLSHAARIVIASCPQHEGDAELRMSPYLQHWPEQPAETLFSAATQAIEAATLETLSDEPVPPVDLQLLSRKDNSLLSAQALNPQLAFVQFRLHGRRVENLAEQLLPNERGQLVHIALSLLWQSLQTSSELHTLDDAEWQRRIAAVCHQALEQRARFRQQDWPPHWQRLEHQALCALVHEWIALEKQRSNGFRLIANETPVTVKLSDLELQLRVDRIDQLDDGRLSIIDYKTGRSWRPPDWLDERPTDVQLMLYALAREEPIAALVAARVRANECRFIGLQDDSGLPAIRRDPLLDDYDFADLRTHWQQTLSALAEEFLQGEARNIAYDEKACAAHPLAPFLRLHAIADDESEDE